MKDKTLPVLIKEADAVFSEYIRLRDSKDGKVNCFICGKPMYWKDSQCGHFINRDDMPTRYDEMNCHAIDEECNCYDAKHNLRYHLKMHEVYGEAAVDRLLAKARGLQKFHRFELQEIIDLYKEKVKQLKL